MLSKRICKQCWKNEKIVDLRIALYNLENLNERWKSNCLQCPYSLTDDCKTCIRKDENPPRWCPYELEHLIASQKNVK